MTDLALQLMDAARGALPGDPSYRPGMAANVMEAGALALAIQAVFLSEMMESRDAQKDCRPSPERFMARFLGVGQGIGHCVASVEEAGRVIAIDKVMQGMASAMAARRAL